MHNDHAPGETHHGPGLNIYYSVFGALAVLTVVTVAVSRIHLAPVTAVVIAFMIAISKATLVAAYFMHLKYDSKAIHLMAIMPTLLTALLLMALMPDVGMADGPLVAGAPEQRSAVLEAGDSAGHHADEEPADDQEDAAAEE